jgi:hypothetical protein
VVDLTRKRERDRLAVRREPYWHRLNKGMALGFRRGPDSWVVRLTATDGKRSKTYHALDDSHLDFDNAKERSGGGGNDRDAKIVPLTGKSAQ